LVEDERAVSQDAHAKVVFRFHARDLHLVLGNMSGKPVAFRVTLDGKAPQQNHGEDIDAQGKGEITGQKLYQLIRQKDDEKNSDHTFEIEFLSPQAEVYAFTFG